MTRSNAEWLRLIATWVPAYSFQLNKAANELDRSELSLWKELNDIATAIGSDRFLDPPDGGDVSLSEQVSRMREALEAAEAALAQFDVEAILEFGFASFQDRSFELIARNEAGNEITLKGKLEKQDLEQIDKIFPTCVFVKYALAALAQSDAEPVACSDCKDIERCRDNGRCWISGDGISSSPAASAGLIEAAEYAESLARASTDKGKAKCLTGFAGLLRSRAVDRSGK